MTTQEQPHHLVSDHGLARCCVATRWRRWNKRRPLARARTSAKQVEASSSGQCTLLDYMTRLSRAAGMASSAIPRTIDEEPPQTTTPKNPTTWGSARHVDSQRFCSRHQESVTPRSAYIKKKKQPYQKKQKNNNDLPGRGPGGRLGMKHAAATTLDFVEQTLKMDADVKSFSRTANRSALLADFHFKK